MMSRIRSYLPDQVNNTVWYYVGNAIYRTQHLINTEYTASQITDQIYIGNLASAMNADQMKENGITHILSIVNGGYEVYPDNFKYHIIHINDDPWVDIGQYFDEGVMFIHNALTNQASTESKSKEGWDDDLANLTNKIMVHCHQGVSRSVTMVLAYLLWKKNNTEQIPQNKVDEEVQLMIDYVKEKRNIANPNTGFVKALTEYIYKINGYPTISMDKIISANQDNKL